LLALLLACDACRSLINEQLSQPTNLGFMVLVSGLCLAAMPAAQAVSRPNWGPSVSPNLRPKLDLKAS